MARKRTNQIDLTRFFIGGTTFYFPKGITKELYNERIVLIRKLFKDIGEKWDGISKDIAKGYARGDKLIKIGLENRKPDPKYVFPSKSSEPVPEYKSEVSSNQSNYPAPKDPKIIELMERYKAKRKEAMSITYDELLETYPNVDFHIPDEELKRLDDDITRELERKSRIRRIELEQNAVGTFHEAMDKYIQYRTKQFIDPKYEKVTGSGNHFLSILRAVKAQNSDFPLYSLGLTRLNALFEPYTQRKENITKKTAGNYIGEIKRFLKWLALNESIYGWSYPKNYELMDFKVKNLPSDAHDKLSMEIDIFTKEEIKTLLENASQFEKLIILTCINCSFGPAEFGRISWGEITFGYHNWTTEGLKLDSGLQNKSFITTRRVKSKVVGSWILWEESLLLIEWWKTEWIKIKKRSPKSEERILITSTGNDYYRECTRNGASSFGNMWKRLLIKCNNKVRNLPIGTLRKQLPDFLKENPELASVALCHGTPHKNDKLLYKHYANKPWNALFKAQLEYREYLEIEKALSNDSRTDPDPCIDKKESQV